MAPDRKPERLGRIGSGRIGRPPKPEDERRAINLTFRARKNLRQRLLEAAEENQRSLSEETEFRIETTFRDQDVVMRALGGQNAEGVVRPILYFLGVMERQGRNWRNDPDVADAVREGINTITEAIFLGPLSLARQNKIQRAAGIRGRKKGQVAITVASAALAVLQALGLAEKSAQ
jgi:hypothetical protein